MRVPLVLLLVACACNGPQRPLPEHVVLIVVDTLRADHLDAFGYPRETAPRIRELAQRGVLFERAYSQSSWTSPSMVSLMTGRYLAGPWLGIPEDLDTLTEALQRSGFATAGFVANPIVNEENGFHRGFDRFERLQDYGDDEPLLEWIRASAGRRTFTYVHLNEPHDPYGPPDPGRRYLHDPPPLPGEQLAFFDRIGQELNLVDGESNAAAIRREVAGYDDDILWTDTRIGKIIDALQATGQTQSSALILTADHGEGLWTRVAVMGGQREAALAAGEPPTLLNTLMPTHGNQVNMELVHVPLILVAPGIAGPRRVTELVENVDLLPTILELCDLRDPGGLHGESLFRVLEDPDTWYERKPVAFTMTRLAGSVVTPDGWQLIVPTQLGICQEGLEVALYDLNEDPFARNNLAHAQPEMVRTLTRYIVERRAQGIPGDDQPLTQGNLGALGALGYLDGGQVDKVKELFAAESTESLLEMLGAVKRSCLARLEAARALAARELTKDEQEALRGLLDTEPSSAVQDEIRKAL